MTLLTGILANDASDLEVKIGNIRKVVRALPSAHFDLLKRLMEHLDKYVSSVYLLNNGSFVPQSDRFRRTKSDDS